MLTGGALLGDLDLALREQPVWPFPLRMNRRRYVALGAAHG